MIQETQPVGALHLADYSVSRTPDSGCPHSFRLSKKGGASLHLATSSAEKTEQWIAALSQATKPMVVYKYYTMPFSFIKNYNCKIKLNISHNMKC